MTRTESRAAIFRSEDERYIADDCEPLRRSAVSQEVTLVARTHGSYPGTPLPDGLLPEVRTVGYWDAVRDQRWGLDWHRNEGVEITYLARGSIGFSVGDYETELKPGDLTITRPWQPHRVGAPDVTASKLYWLILDVGIRRPNQFWKWPGWLLWSNDLRDQLTQNLSQNEQPVWHASPEIAMYFEQIGNYIQSSGTNVEVGRLKLYINGLLISLAELLVENQPVLDPRLSSSERTVAVFLSDLQSRCHEEWTLENMALACGLRRTRFIHYCKQITNMSPAEYLTWCRVKLAQEMLGRVPELTVTQVAMNCGFMSSQYFSTVFRQSVGCTPRDFRAQLRLDDSKTARV